VQRGASDTARKAKPSKALRDAGQFTNRASLGAASCRGCRIRLTQRQLGVAGGVVNELQAGSITGEAVLVIAQPVMARAISGGI